MIQYDRGNINYMCTQLEIVFVGYIGKCTRKDSLKRKEIHSRIVFIPGLNFEKTDVKCIVLY